MYVKNLLMKETITNSTRPKVLAVASFGGHLVQLLRMMRPLAHMADVAVVSTAEEGRPSGFGSYDVIADFSRTTPWRAVAQAGKLKRIIKRERPDLVISTGAAPGLLAIAVAKMMGIRTIWVDSIANADRLSGSGKIASKIADKTLTQWPHLAGNGVECHGNVL